MISKVFLCLFAWDDLAFGGGELCRLAVLVTAVRCVVHRTFLRGICGRHPKHNAHALPRPCLCLIYLLFVSQVSNATGKLTVTPVCNFDQTDLCADDVMLLDTVTSVFVWVGPQANETERTEVWCGARLNYLARRTRSRPVKSGYPVPRTPYVAICVLLCASLLLLVAGDGDRLDTILGSTYIRRHGLYETKSRTSTPDMTMACLLSFFIHRTALHRTALHRTAAGSSP